MPEPIPNQTTSGIQSFEYSSLIEKELKLGRRVAALIPVEFDTREGQQKAISLLLSHLRDKRPQDINIDDIGSFGEFLKNFFFSFVREDEFDEVIKICRENDDRTIGKLSYINSANCLKDEIRTKRFIDGLSLAINKQVEINGADLHIIDAGCGSIPIFSIFSALKNKAIKVTAIESNPASYEIAKRIIDNMQLADQITIVNQDILSATDYREADIIISETFSPALTAENGTKILAHLNKFKKATGVTLPEEIHLSVCLTDYNQWKDDKPRLFRNGFAITPDLDFAPTIIKLGSSNLSKLRFDVKKEGSLFLQPQLVSIATKFKIYNNVFLNPNESCITLHVPVWNKELDLNKFNLTLDPRSFGDIVIEYREGDQRIYGSFFSSNILILPKTLINPDKG